VSVDHGAFDEGMAELFADGEQARAAIQQVGREAVPKQMGINPPIDGVSSVLHDVRRPARSAAIACAC
jgi:hypothetical protein